MSKLTLIMLLFSLNTYSQSNLSKISSYEVCSNCDGKGKLAPSELSGFRGKGVPRFVWINVKCEYCKNWSNWQKTVAACPKCENKGYYLTTRPAKASDYIRCSDCKGTGNNLKSKILKWNENSRLKILPTESERGNYRENRKALYLALVNVNIITNELYPDWVDLHFISERNISNFYNFLLRNRLYLESEKSFYNYFACDVYPNSSYCQ